MSALMVAAPRSGAGKTTVALGLMAALRARGEDVRAAKCGPDYIDGAFAQAATGTASVNLDSWAMPPSALRSLAALRSRTAGRSLAAGPGVLVVEAAMGLFDGTAVPGPGGGNGSAASLARALALPVLLVLDVTGQAQTAAAVAFGCARLDPAVAVVGVVLNNVASARHAARARDAIVAAGLPVLGAIPPDPAIRLPERHLGLVGAGEHANLAAHFDKLAALIEAHCDVPAILAAGRRLAEAGAPPVLLPPPGQRIAIARDAAFAFLYPHVLAGWHAAGAALSFFSPLADEPPEGSADAVWLPGGYPELHAAQIAANARFLAALRDAAGRGAAIHGECGGYMVLGRALTDADGTTHAMAGLLDHATDFSRRRLHLGYRRARLAAASALGPAGATIAGHEHHHTVVADRGTDAPLAELEDADGNALGPDGGVRGRVSGGFFHAIARA